MCAEENWKRCIGLLQLFCRVSLRLSIHTGAISSVRAHSYKFFYFLHVCFYFSLGSSCNHIAAVLFKVEHAWTSGLVNVKSPTSVECTWNKYGSKKVGVTPKLLSDMDLKKPHYKKKGALKNINPPSRKLFKPKRANEDTDTKSCLKRLVASLYNSIPNACGFQYIDMDVSANYFPEDDVNVQDTVCVQTTAEIPRSLPEIASTVDNVEDLISEMGNITTEQVECIESATRGQSSNENWSSQRIGRITASISRRVLTKMDTLRRTEGCVSTSALVNSICQPAKLSTLNLPAFQYGHQMESEARAAYLKLNKPKHKN